MYSSTCRVPTNEKFDAVIINVSDPIEAGPAVALYTQEFYQLVSRRLNKHGTFVTQAGSASFIPFPHSSLAGEGDEATCFSPIKNTLATVFDHAIPYSAPVASFVVKTGALSWHSMGVCVIDCRARVRSLNYALTSTSYYSPRQLPSLVGAKD